MNIDQVKDVSLLYNSFIKGGWLKRDSLVLLSEVIKIGKMCKNNDTKQLMREIYNEINYHITCLDSKNVKDVVEIFNGRCVKC